MKVKTIRSPRVTVRIVNNEHNHALKFLLNEYEFANLRLEYAKGLWKGHRIQVIWKNADGTFTEGYIGYNGACHPMSPPQFTIIDRLYLEIFSMKFEKEPEHWKEARLEDEKQKVN